MEVTAWYDDAKRIKALQSINDVYYYMIHASNVEERWKWAVEYTKMLQANETIA